MKKLILIASIVAGILTNSYAEDQLPSSVDWIRQAVREAIANANGVPVDAYAYTPMPCFRVDWMGQRTPIDNHRCWFATFTIEGHAIAVYGHSNVIDDICPGLFHRTN